MAAIPNDSVNDLSKPIGHKVQICCLASAALTLGCAIGYIAGISSAAVTLPILSTLLSLVSSAYLVSIVKVQPRRLVALSVAVVAFNIGLICCLSAGIALKIKLGGPDREVSLLKNAETSKAEVLETLCNSSRTEDLTLLCKK